MEASPKAPRGSRRTIVASLAATAAGLAALGLILGLALDPAFFVIWGLAAVALILAWYFASRAAPPDGLAREPRTGEATDPVAREDAVHDPTHSPYGRPDP